VQQRQNPLDLPTNIRWWFGLSVDVAHNNHTHRIRLIRVQAKARWGALSGSGKIIGEPGLS
jgi:hypothetical protein